MLIPYSGYLENATQKYPYVIIDTEETFSDINAAKNRLLSMPQTGIISTASGSLASTEAYFNLPNIWKDVGHAANSNVAVLGEQGIAIACDLLSGTRTAINKNNAFTGYPTYSSVKMPNLPSLYIHTYNMPSTYTTNWQTTTYSDGVLLEFDYSTNYTKLFFSIDGAIYFVSSTNINPYIGYFPANTVNYTPIGRLDTLRMYCFRAFASQANGSIKNAVGSPAPNYRIMAFKRSSGKLVGQAISDSAGNYAMPLSALKGEQLFMVCLDDDGVTPDFEAQIIDRVTV